MKACKAHDVCGEERGTLSECTRGASTQVHAFHHTCPVLQPTYHEDTRGHGASVFLFPVALIIGSQIWYFSCSYVIALKSSVSRRKAVNTECSTIEEDGKQIQGARSPGAVFSICWATDSQLIMQVVINIKAWDKMGRACSSGATGDRSLLSSVSHLHTAFPRKHHSASVFSLEIKKKKWFSTIIEFC